jgi:GTP-binding protein
MGKPIVAIVGRPNVGKSTLFNRLAGTRAAIVEDTPGVTRDRLYFDTDWRGRCFTVVDTGGIVMDEKPDTILGQVRRQAQIAVDEASAVLFMVDGRAGLTPEDEALAALLRKTRKPVLLVVNKIEQFENNPAMYEFYGLGLGDPIPVSASHGMNTGDMLDALTELFGDQAEEEYEPDVIKIAVVGRPNVGKSSLVNAILGEERSIVSPVPGTTRDATDSPFTHEGQRYVIIDTAGMRKRGRVEAGTERYSVIRSLRAVDRCDVAVVMIDGKDGLIEQDKRVAGYVHEAGRGVVLTVNKWDLVEKDQNTMHKYERELREGLSFMQYAPTLFISALTRQRVAKLPELVKFVSEQHSHRVATSVLNDVIRDAVQMNPAPADKGKRLKILYATQAGVKPPNFVLFVNEPKIMHFSYERYLENQIRKNFGFEGTPVRITLRRKDEPL